MPPRPTRTTRPRAGAGPAVFVKPAQISTQAVISSPALASKLIQDRAEALKLLSGVAPVRADDISIDDQGRVVVANATFASKLSGRSLAAAGNGICGAGC